MKNYEKFIRIDAEAHALLKRIAAENGVAIHDIANAIIRDWQSNERTVLVQGKPINAKYKFKLVE